MKRKNYRKVYEDHYGKIPIDEFGRKYDIHHIDGDKTNDSPENLVALSIKEHYEIHYSMGDFGSCFKIAQRMKLSPTEISDLVKKSSLKRVSEGTHNFLGGEIQRNSQINLVKTGKHHFLKKKDGSSFTRDLVDSGTHICLQKGKNAPAYDHTIRNFVHKDGRIEICTGYELRQKYPYISKTSLSNLLSGLSKSTHGWYLQA